ncbi:MAG: hypothetical protein FWH14_02860 [Oscillospiraceae bacterium]|nr:hypothetical protein [Oscillospiraceae bacterium]
MTIEFNEKTKIRFNRFKGQVYLHIPIVCEGSTDSDEILFMYDTGAYLTVINRERYEWYNLDKLPRKEVSIGGYVGTASGYLFQIPGLIVGRRLLTGVWAFSPKSMDVKQNLLGDNVIEYFMPFQDNLNDCFYFIDNPKPEPYIHPNTKFSLACDNVIFRRDRW